MAIDDVWRVAITVKTFNENLAPAEAFFQWVIVTHYQDTTGMEDDTFASLSLIAHQLQILQTHIDLFAANTRVVRGQTLNITSAFSDDQVLNQFIGKDGVKCLPAQVAVCVYGRGAALGRRAIKYYSSIDTKWLGENGVLKSDPLIESLKDAAWSPAFGFFGGIFIAGMWGPLLVPDFLPVTRTFASPSWRTQRRRVLTMVQ